MQNQPKQQNRNQGKRNAKKPTVMLIQNAKPKSNRRNNQRSQKGNQQIAAPIALGSMSRVGGPRYKNSKNGSIRVCHTELIGDVHGSTDYSVTKTDINAGLSTMFAWLSQIAPNYESYKFKKLNFRFVPACSTSTSGVIYLTVEFDSKDAVPTTERQIASYDGSVTGSVWARHNYSCASRNLNKRSSYFVRNGAIPSSSDIQLYDIGYLIVATSGNPDTSILGKMWVDYEVELVTPQLGNVAVGNSLSVHLSGTDRFATVPTVLGNAPLVPTVQANVLTLTATAPYDGVITYAVTGTGIDAADQPFAGTANFGSPAWTSNTAATVGVGTIIFDANEGDTVTVSFSDFTTVGSYDIRIGQYNFANA